MASDNRSGMLLDGIRVIDWSTFQIGPAAAAALADIGAEVVHVEPVQEEDGGRPELGGRGTSYVLPQGRSSRMEDLNRNKKSLAVDLARPEGQQIIYRLVARSDVFITNFRLKAALKLGMDYQTLRRHNPRLVYARASAFGDAGPLKDAPGFAMTGAAHSGLMMSSGEEGSPPTANSTGVPDRTTAMYLAFGIMAALFWRDRGGTGQEVTTSMLGCLIHTQSLNINTELLTGQRSKRFTRKESDNVLFNYFQCKDGRWLAITLANADRYWPVLCRQLGMPHLEKDPQFGDRGSRKKNSGKLFAILEEAFLSRDCDDWLKTLGAGDLPCSRINSVSDLATDPQVLENEYIVNWDHPALGRVKVVGFPVRWSSAPATFRAPAPGRGEHDEEILRGICGYSGEELNRLRAEGVIV